MNIMVSEDALESSRSLFLAVQFSVHLDSRAWTGNSFSTGCSGLDGNPTGRGL